MLRKNDMVGFFVAKKYCKPPGKVKIIEQLEGLK